MQVLAAQDTVHRQCHKIHCLTRQRVQIIRLRRLHMCLLRQTIFHRLQVRYQSSSKPSSALTFSCCISTLTLNRITFFQVIAQLHRHIHRQVHLITVRHRHATLLRVQITGTFYMHILFISSHQLCTVHMYCCIYCDSFHVANFDRIIFIIYFDIYKYSLSINKLLLKICYSPTSPNYSPTSPNYFSPATNTPGKFFVDSNSLNSQEKSINSNSFC